MQWTGGSSESFGKPVAVGDIIGCMLDIHDKTVSYSLNGELLLDASGNEMAFSDIVDGTYVPAATLGNGQKIRLIFGQDVNMLKCFTTCGLQEGYQPFCVNMNKNMTFWYNKDEPLFINIDECQAPIDVSRIPAGADSPPALKITHKLFETQDKVPWEFLRLSLPVTCHDELIEDHEKAYRWEEVKRRKEIKRQQILAGGGAVRHPAKLEQHMLSSGFSMDDVKDLQRTYSEGEDGGETPTSPGMGMQTPWQKKQASLVKTKSFDNTLGVPSLQEAKTRMKEAEKKATSIEALDSGQSDSESVDARSKREKSPFR